MCTVKNRHFTITEFSELSSQTSQSLVQEIAVGILCYHKFCARWVSKLLIFIEDHNKQRLAAALTLLEDYDKSGNQIIDHILIGYETKWQFMEWGHRHSPKKLRKCVETLLARKNHGYCVLDRSGSDSH
ncbi:hypothetical protein J6590_050005 [Homalodisca vitripennis]|nr:hypothetical protein J6590_070023 [Homalodisca vitripennis]KAG8277096.1 hypothetical protein J6590_050005 [Homalodisca vitripennis]